MGMLKGFSAHYKPTSCACADYLAYLLVNPSPSPGLVSGRVTPTRHGQRAFGLGLVAEWPDIRVPGVACA